MSFLSFSLQIYWSCCFTNGDSRAGTKETNGQRPTTAVDVRAAAAAATVSLPAKATPRSYYAFKQQRQQQCCSAWPEYTCTKHIPRRATLSVWSRNKHIYCSASHEFQEV